MTKRIVRISSMALAALAMTITAASAAPGDDTIVANVPFAFTAGHTALPAGSYVLTEQAGDPNIMRIANSSGRQLAYVITVPAADYPQATAVKPQLEFQKVGGQFVLSTINADDGRELAVPSAMLHHEGSARATATR